MAELTLEALRAELAPLRAQLEALDGRMNALEGQIVAIGGRVSAIDAQMVVIGAHASGVPIIGRTVSVIQQEQRQLRAAFNDFAQMNVPAGEITAMHEDIARLAITELEARIVTLERLVRELQERSALARRKDDELKLTVSEPLSATLRNGTTAVGTLWMHVSRRGSFEGEVHMRMIARMILRELAEDTITG
jgi:predicted  nucleic acid-binding Zn-ribbon protein